MKDFLAKLLSASKWAGGAVVEYATGLQPRHYAILAFGLACFVFGGCSCNCWHKVVGDPDAGKPPLAFGWVNDPAAVAHVTAALKIPSLDATPIKGTWDGKPVCLWKYAEKATGKPLPVHKQRIGSCVSHGYCQAIKVLQCVEIALRGENESFQPVSHAWIYGGAREDNGMLRGGDGLVGAYAAKFVSEVGNLTDAEVGDSPTNDDLAEKWGRKGVPKELRAKAGKFRVRSFVPIRTFAEAADAIANGYPVPVCSQQGFAMRRDKSGFGIPQGSWAHCMLFCGVAEIDGRRALLCWNSWGEDWISGPTALDQPPGSFWVDEKTVARMLGMKDTFALSQFDGFPRQQIDNFVRVPQLRRPSLALAY